MQATLSACLRVCWHVRMLACPHICGHVWTCRIPIPPGLHSLMHPDQKAYLVTEQNTDNDVLLSSDDMLTLFKPTVDRVVDLVKTHLGRSGTICSVVSRALLCRPTKSMPLDNLLTQSSDSAHLLSALGALWTVLHAAKAFFHCMAGHHVH